MPPRPATERDPAVERDLAAAEAKGLALLLWCRTAVLVPVLLWLLLAWRWPDGWLGAGVVVWLLALGGIHLWLLRRGRERPWQRYLLVTLDFASLGWLAATAPLLAGEEVPRALLFRTYGAHYLFLFLALSALALSPRYVVCVGLLAQILLWGIFASVVLRMEHTLSWSDLPLDATAAEYVALVLDPAFVGTGNRIEESFVLLLSTVVLALAVRRARLLVRRHAAAERQRRRALEVFGQYVPEGIARRLVESPEELAPQAREATILIADIQGFTGLSEQRRPAELIPPLNQFFEEAGERIAAAGGVVFAYLGDGFLAAFNVADDCPGHAAAGLAAGRQLQALVTGREFDGLAFRLRIGVATGGVAAGSVGGGKRQSYTVYGDTVNLAQRLEALCKEVGCGLLASETSWTAAGSPQGWERVGELSVRGRQLPVTAYRPAP